MAYCFLHHAEAEGGHLLADVDGLGWGIFEVEAHTGVAPGRPVPDALARLIESAKRYPPALALARDELEEVFGGHRPDEHLLARAYATALKTHMSRQHEAAYVMAQALPGRSQDLREGEWYWVLEVSGSPAVASWVSADFHVRKADLAAFDLTGQQLKRLGYAG